MQTLSHASTVTMPGYVILTHDHPFLHWDLMLQQGDSLRTWRLLEEPVPGHTIRAESLPDHRIAWLDFEGPVSGNRGTVRRWDSGAHEILGESDDFLRVKLSGRVLSGVAVVQVNPADGHWEFRI